MYTGKASLELDDRLQLRNKLYKSNNKILSTKSIQERLVWMTDYKLVTKGGVY